MKSFLFNRKLRVAFAVGAALALALWLTFAIGIILGFGGGSLVRGFPIGMSYLSFYGVILIPFCVVVGLVAIVLSRFLGAGVTAIPSFIALVALAISSILTSDPRSQLSRVTGRESIPAEIPVDPAVPIQRMHPAVVTYKMVFERDIEGVSFYEDRKGLIGAFSPDEQTFRLFWSPTIRRSGSQE